ncbi:MAG: hypothetical protein F4X72_05365, partial [Dehalococcoidia bacterium]|nr:hypothetical protein [Dehalococcoidia bacterium]
MTTNRQDSFQRPFPALTPAQRYHFDVFGYVIIENTLTVDETSAVLEALQNLKREFEATGDPTGTIIRNCRVSGYSPTNMHFAHVLETDPAVLAYVTNPRLVGMAEEVVGGVVRLSESEGLKKCTRPPTKPHPRPKNKINNGTRAA